MSTIRDLKEHKIFDNHGVFQNNKADLHNTFSPLAYYSDHYAAQMGQSAKIYGCIAALQSLLTCIWVGAPYAYTYASGEMLATFLEMICSVASLKLHHPLKVVVAGMHIRRQASHLSMHRGCQVFSSPNHHMIERRHSIRCQTVMIYQEIG